MQVNDVAAAFADETQRAFAFLASDGFSCVSSSSSRVRYESSSVYVEVRHSECDGEVAISFGRLAKNEEFSFTLFLRLVNPQLECELGERLAENLEQLRECLAKLSVALQEEGRPILTGDQLAFERMKRVRWWDFRPDALKDVPDS
jgi:hypothetical protein